LIIGQLKVKVILLTDLELLAVGEILVGEIEITIFINA
jgi:hypothetical protein